MSKSYHVTNTSAIVAGKENLSLLDALALAKEEPGIIVLDCDIRADRCKDLLSQAFPEIDFPVKIEGNGHTIQGNGIGVGLVLSASGCRLENLRIAGFTFDLWLKPRNHDVIRDTKLLGCHFDDSTQAGLVTGSEATGTGIDGLTVENCVFDKRLSDREETEHYGVNFIALIAGSLMVGGAKDTHDNCVKNIVFRGCKISGDEKNKYEQGIFFVGGYEMGYVLLPQDKLTDYMQASKGTARNSVVENILCEGNELADFTDVGIMIGGMSCALNVDGCTVKNGTIRNNHIFYENNAISICGADAYGMGDLGCCVKNVQISDISVSGNICEKRNSLFNANYMGILVWGGLLENGIATCEANRLSRISITNNTVCGADYAIEVEAAHAFNDESYKSYLKDIEIDDLIISGNTVFDSRYAVYLAGARLEGRHDNVPLHAPVPPNPLKRHTLLAQKCLIRNVKIEKNTIRGHRFGITCLGAEVAGESMAKGCAVLELQAKDNKITPSIDGKRFFKGKQLLFEKGKASGCRVKTNLGDASAEPLSIDSPLKDLLKNESTKKIVEEAIPELLSNAGVKLVMGMSFRAICGFDGTGLTQEDIEKIAVEIEKAGDSTAA